jgi:transposase-like protein
MEKFNYYSDEFKKSVVQQVLSGRLGKDEARRRYGIRGKSAVLNWIRKFDASQMHEMKKQRSTQPQPLSPLEAENERLREALELEQLRTLSLNVMIDLAEEQFKVPIRKKSGAKQLKK